MSRKLYLIIFFIVLSIVNCNGRTVDSDSDSHWNLAPSPSDINSVNWEKVIDNEELKTTWMRRLVLPHYLQTFLDQAHSEQSVRNGFTDLLFKDVNNTNCKGHVLELLKRFEKDEEDEKKPPMWTAEQNAWAAQSKIKLDITTINSSKNHFLHYFLN